MDAEVSLPSVQYPWYVYYGRTLSRLQCTQVCSRDGVSRPSATHPYWDRSWWYESEPTDASFSLNGVDWPDQFIPVC